MCNFTFSLENALQFLAKKENIKRYHVLVYEFEADEGAGNSETLDTTL